MEKYIGQFTENDLINGVDKIKVAEEMEKTGLKYVNTEFVKKGKKVVGMKVWLCDMGSFKL